MYFLLIISEIRFYFYIFGFNCSNFVVFIIFVFQFKLNENEKTIAELNKFLFQLVLIYLKNYFFML